LLVIIKFLSAKRSDSKLILTLRIRLSIMLKYGTLYALLKLQ
jgi:hypothetical protein